MERMTFVAACNKYFGRKEGQNLTQFQEELKTLSLADREYFKALFPTVGIEIIEAR